MENDKKLKGGEDQWFQRSIFDRKTAESYGGTQDNIFQRQRKSENFQTRSRFFWQKFGKHDQKLRIFGRFFLPTPQKLHFSFTVPSMFPFFPFFTHLSNPARFSLDLGRWWKPLKHPLPTIPDAPSPPQRQRCINLGKIKNE